MIRISNQSKSVEIVQKIHRKITETPTSVPSVQRDKQMYIERGRSKSDIFLNNLS